MATDLERLMVRLEASTRQLENGLGRARAETNRRLAEIDRRFERTNRSVSRALNQLGRTAGTVFSAVAAAMAVREVIQAGDAWARYGNQLRSVSTDVGRQVASLDELADVAMETRTSLEATVDLYVRMERAGARLGRSQEDMLRLTRIINQAFVAGGASTSEQAAAITQLSQAMASGALQGDELRSIRENAPLLAQAIADAMGVSIGELRDLGAEGRITADVMMRAFDLAGERIGAQTGSMVLTVEQAMTNLRTAAVQAVGGADQAAGGTSRLAETINDLAETIQDNREGIASFFRMLADGGEALITAAAAGGRFRDFVSETLAQQQASPQSVAQIREELDRILELTAEYERRIAVGGRHATRPGPLRLALGADEVAAIDDEFGGLSGTEAAERILAALNLRYGELAARLRTVRAEAEALGQTGTGTDSGIGGGEESDDARRARQTRERLELTRQIEAAEAQGNTKRQRALERELALYNRIIEYQEAGLADARAQAIVDQALVDAAEDIARHKQEYLEAQERATVLAESQLQHELAMAEAIGDDKRVRALERELQIRERIATLTAHGVSSEDARTQATGEVDSLEAARAQGERAEQIESFREAARSAFAKSFADAMRTGDVLGAAQSLFEGAANAALTQLGEQVFDALFGGIFDQAQAAVTGATQGQAAGAVIGVSMTTAGAAAGATIAGSMQAAGAAAAAQIGSSMRAAAAMSGGGGGGGAGSGIGSIIGGIIGSFFGAPGVGAGIGGAIGGSFGGGKAYGGPVKAGMSYMVGERGPERFVPDTSGVIVPRGPASGSATREIVYVPHFVSVDRSPEFEVSVQRIAAPIAAQTSMVATSNLEGKMARRERDRLYGLR